MLPRKFSLARPRAQSSRLGIAHLEAEFRPFYKTRFARPLPPADAGKRQAQADAFRSIRTPLPFLQVGFSWVPVRTFQRRRAYRPRTSGSTRNGSEQNRSAEMSRRIPSLTSKLIMRMPKNNSGRRDCFCTYLRLTARRSFNFPHADF